MSRSKEYREQLKKSETKKKFKPSEQTLKNRAKRRRKKLRKIYG